MACSNLIMMDAILRYSFGFGIRASRRHGYDVRGEVWKGCGCLRRVGGCDDAALHLDDAVACRFRDVGVQVAVDLRGGTSCRLHD